MAHLAGFGHGNSVTVIFANEDQGQAVDAGEVHGFVGFSFAGASVAKEHQRYRDVTQHLTTKGVPGGLGQPGADHVGYLDDISWNVGALKRGIDARCCTGLRFLPMKDSITWVGVSPAAILRARSPVVGEQEALAVFFGGQQAALAERLRGLGADAAIGTLPWRFNAQTRSSVVRTSTILVKKSMRSSLVMPSGNDPSGPTSVTPGLGSLWGLGLVLCHGNPLPPEKTERGSLVRPLVRPTPSCPMRLRANYSVPSPLELVRWFRRRDWVWTPRRLNLRRGQLYMPAPNPANQAASRDHSASMGGIVRACLYCHSNRSRPAAASRPNPPSLFTGLRGGHAGENGHQIRGVPH